MCHYEHKNTDPVFSQLRIVEQSRFKKKSHVHVLTSGRSWKINQMIYIKGYIRENRDS
jgi:hypothetical protein